jgi:hypothetical protein
VYPRTKLDTGRYDKAGSDTEGGTARVSSAEAADSPAVAPCSSALVGTRHSPAWQVTSSWLMGRPCSWMAQEPAPSHDREAWPVALPISDCMVAAGLEGRGRVMSRTQAQLSIDWKSSQCC